MGGGFSDHVRKLGVFAENSVVLWRIMLRLLLQVESVMQCTPPTPWRRLVMSGLAKASSWQQTYGMCYVCFGFVCSEQACCGSFLRALRLLSTILKTDSDRYAGMTLRVQCTVRKLTLNPTSFLGVFWPYNGLGVSDASCGWASPRLYGSWAFHRLVTWYTTKDAYASTWNQQLFQVQIDSKFRANTGSFRFHDFWLQQFWFHYQRP